MPASHAEHSVDEIAGVRNDVFWLDDPDRPAPLPALMGSARADLVVVGGGYTGLWTALLARERYPERSVILLEGYRCGDGASGRNGGFMNPSLTHGFDNGMARWPEELDELDRLGAENLREIEETLQRYGIECDYHLGGELLVAESEADLEGLRETYEEMAAHGHEVRWLGREQIPAKGAHFLGGSLEVNSALVNPAQLVFGLRRVCLELGVQIYENTWVTALKDKGDRMLVVTDQGLVDAGQVALGTNAASALVRPIRSRIVPVHDYVLMSERLTDEQFGALGWTDGSGMSDASSVFVYYRKTADRRILWGGYDAVYFFGGKAGPEYEARTDIHEHLDRLFRERFPQLADVRWEYRWAGVIDTCSRFCAFFGSTHRDKVAYAVGYTGLGVAATRFGAQVMLDLLAGEETERTRLRMVREKPLPFPPEPFKWVGITATRRAMEKQARTGRRGPWLTVMDKLGLGFDS
jgi:glycine/D-amino acid oxidase-like deaminating enzyme